MGKNTQQKTGNGRGVIKKNPILREFSSGGVVFKKENGKILWLVCRSNPSQKYPEERWRLPKGWLDDDPDRDYPGPMARGEKRATQEEIQQNALKEIREEGGVETRIIKKLGTTKYFTTTVQGPVLKFVTYFLTEWIRDAAEGYGTETSKVTWLEYEEAYKTLHASREKEILKKAHELQSSLV